MTTLKHWRKDAIAVVLLVFLWSVFFGRMLTPNPVDRMSFKQGDFSGQFVAFGAYQYERWAIGEVPLWNPYNNAGLPFIADTQAAVFYPPRLLTIALAQATTGWGYRTLEVEAVLHVLAFSLAFYAMMRVLTAKNTHSHYGSVIGALIAGYSGWTSGYPPLQLALLEAATWSPLVILGIHQATQTQHLKWGWVFFAGFMLGNSWLAGHPQTSWFITYLGVAYLCFRAYHARVRWQSGVLAIALMGIVTLGTTAVTLFAGGEYLLRTARADVLGYADKANGFPLQDVLQFFIPYSVSVFSPLYVGVGTLVWAWAGIKASKTTHFWLGVGIVALLLSFGGNTPVYPALYNLLPGLSFFRGQERAAFLVMFCLATLAGYGISTLATPQKPALTRMVVGLLAFIGVLALGILFLWMAGNLENSALLGHVLVSFSIVGVLWWCLGSPMPAQRVVMIAVGVLAFELFTANMGLEAVYDPFPAEKQPAPYATSLIEIVQADTETPFRVDGFRGLRDNYGSQFGIMDIRGISPLFLTNAQSLIYQHYINNPRAWEVLAVRYVFSERGTFPNTPTQVLGQGRDHEGDVYLHQLADPRPYAHFVFVADVVDSDAFSLSLLNDPNYQPRQKVILQQEPTLRLPETAPTTATARFLAYTPEKLTLALETPENGILTLAHIDYAGWQASLNGAETPILRAYGVTMALEIPAGTHTLELVYNPLSYRLGAMFSLVTWATAVILLIVSVIRMIRRTRRA